MANPGFAQEDRKVLEATPGGSWNRFPKLWTKSTGCHGLQVTESDGALKECLSRQQPSLHRMRYCLASFDAISDEIKAGLKRGASVSRMVLAWRQGAPVLYACGLLHQCCPTAEMLPSLLSEFLASSVDHLAAHSNWLMRLQISKHLQDIIVRPAGVETAKKLFNRPLSCARPRSRRNMLPWSLSKSWCRPGTGSQR